MPFCLWLACIDEHVLAEERRAHRVARLRQGEDEPVIDQKGGGAAEQASVADTARANARANPWRAAMNAARSSFPARDRYVVALGGAGIELARAADLLVRIFDHFLPL